MTANTPIKPYRADWRNASQYPEFGSKDYERLAWEFIRRSKRYADLMTIFNRLAKGEFQKGIKRTSDTCLSGLQCYPQAKPGETARQYHSRMKQLKNRGYILPPKSYLKSQWYMDLDELLLPEAEYDPYKTIFLPYVATKRAPKGGALARFSLPLWPNEIAFRLRLDLSLDSQLDDVRDQFKKARVDAGYNENKRTVNLDYAHFWLRAFDAHHQMVLTSRGQRVSGTWTDEVRKYLLQNPDPSAKRSTIKDHTVEEWRQTAESYVEGDKFATLLCKREKTTIDPTKVVHDMIRAKRSAEEQKGRIPL
jgi:hypothetical protein